MTEQEKEQFEFHKDLFADQQRMLDIARDSNFLLWNSLLTFNAIIVTIFSTFLALYQSGNRTIFFIIILASILSSSLLIWNFKSTKIFYFKSAIDYFDRIRRIEAMTDFEAQIYHTNDLHRIEKRNKSVEVREVISIILIFCELCLIIFLII